MKYHLPRVWKGEALRFRKEWNENAIPDDVFIDVIQERNFPLFIYIAYLAEKHVDAAYEDANEEIIASANATYWMLNNAARRQKVPLPAVTDVTLDTFVSEFWRVTDDLPQAIWRRMKFDNPFLMKGVPPACSSRLNSYRDLGATVVYGALQKQGEVDILSREFATVLSDR